MNRGHSGNTGGMHLISSRRLNLPVPRAAAHHGGGPSVRGTRGPPSIPVAEATQRRPFARKESPDRFETACPSGRGRVAQQGRLASNPETSEAESQCLRKRKSKGSPAGIFLLRKLSTTSRWSSGQSSPRREAILRKRKQQTARLQH